MPVVRKKGWSMRLHRLFCIVILTLLFSTNAAVSNAIPIFSTLGGSGSYDPGNGWGVGIGGAIAVPFTPNETLALDSLSVAASTFTGPSPLTVYIAGGQSVPGTPIESFEFLLPGGGWPSSSLYTATSSIRPVLHGGSTYWAVWSVDSRILSAVIANCNSQNLEGDFYYEFEKTWYSYGQQTLPAISLSGSPVVTPEPSSFLLLGAGLSGMLGFRLRRQKKAIGKNEGTSLDLG